MKLIINIPCFNEEDNLPLVLNEIPEEITGINEIEIQVVDDGSTDNTARIAREFGCIVIRHEQNRGLGSAFQTGIYAALERGFDIFVNTDADNQYPSQKIQDLVTPILDGYADIVVGNREPWNISHFSWIKRSLQWIGNRAIQGFLNINSPDTISGFRAYSVEALLHINVVTKFSYTLDTLVQAAKKNLRVTSIPIVVNPPTRPSRLFDNIWTHVIISLVNFIRVFIIYEPFKTFFYSSLIFLIPGSAFIVRFLYYYFIGQGGGHVQSVIGGAMLVIIGAGVFGFSIVAMLISNNRAYVEHLLYLRKKDLIKNGINKDK